MSGRVHRDVTARPDPAPVDGREGKDYVAVIGIDRYRAWNRLHNAVSDATGALNLFVGLGFEHVGTPLLDDMATATALHRLVTSDLAKLGNNDSLIVFFAGHGYTVTRTFHGGATVKDGYIIPVDGDASSGSAATWMRLESWLKDITRIPAQHILVILDACHSGLALGPIIQWRSRGMETLPREPLHHLRARRSRRIITSALDDQVAMDGGPVPGHSLFTGCLIEALRGGLFAACGQPIVTGSQIGSYVQRRVSEYPSSTQTPDFGALELDDRGELIVDLTREAPRPITVPLLPAPDVAHPQPVAPAPPTRSVARRPVWPIGAVLAALVVSVAAVVVTRDRSTSDDSRASTGHIGSQIAGDVPRSEDSHPNDTAPEARSDDAGSNASTSAGSDVRAQIDKPPAEVVPVLLFTRSVDAFEVFEHGVKVLDGPYVLPVIQGEERTVVIKAKGYKDKPIVVTGNRTKVTFVLERIPVKVGSGSAHVSTPPPPPPPDCTRAIVDPRSKACVAEYCAHHEADPKCALD